MSPALLPIFPQGLERAFEGVGGWSTFLRRSQLGSSMLWKLFSSISPSQTCSPMPTRQLGFPRQFLL